MGLGAASGSAQSGYRVRGFVGLVVPAGRGAAVPGLASGWGAVSWGWLGDGWGLLAVLK